MGVDTNKTGKDRSFVRDDAFEIVLGGGGIKGFGLLGFLKAIEESEIDVLDVTGVSIGSLVGAFYTNGYSVDEISEIFAQEIFEITPGKLFRSLVPVIGGGFGLQPLISSLVENYGLCPQENLRIVAYNVLQKQPVVFDGTDYDLSIALSASCAIPFVMQPVWHFPLNASSRLLKFLYSVAGNPQEGLLVDGGLHHPCPADFCKRQAIIAKLGFVDSLPRQYMGLVDSSFYAMEWASSIFLNKLFPDPEEHLVIDVGVPDVSALSFGVSNATQLRMIQHGYSQTRRSLKEAGFNW